MWLLAFPCLTKSGEVFVWGLIAKNENIEADCKLNPVKVDSFNGEKVAMISCGYKHPMALTESGCVNSWGENSFGQLGKGNEIFIKKPKQI